MSPSAGSAELISSEPPKKRFQHLNKVLETRRREGLNQKSKIPLGKLEIDRYFDSSEPLAEEADPFDYWLTNRGSYSMLSSMAMDMLSIPGSSAPVERVFSTAGESTLGRRNRLSEHNLE